RRPVGALRSLRGAPATYSGRTLLSQRADRAVGVLPRGTAVRAALHKPNLRSLVLQHLAHSRLDASLVRLVVGPAEVIQKIRDGNVRTPICVYPDPGRNSLSIFELVHDQFVLTTPLPRSPLMRGRPWHRRRRYRADARPRKDHPRWRTCARPP